MMTDRPFELPVRKPIPAPGGKGGLMYDVVEEAVYEDGGIIFEEGSPGDRAYVILTGFVEISKTLQGRRVIIMRLQPGEVFGDLEFIGGGRWRSLRRLR